MGVTWATGAIAEMGETGVFASCSEDGLDEPGSLIGGKSSSGIQVLEAEERDCVGRCSLGRRTRWDRA